MTPEQLDATRKEIEIAHEWARRLREPSPSETVREHAARSLEMLAALVEQAMPDADGREETP